MNAVQVECKRCGKCCQEGGPALHSQDLDLVKGGQISIENLITIRKGELANNPVTGKVQAIKKELVKIKGTGKNWNCTYFMVDGLECSIYANRPLSCRTLKCWAPDELLKLVGKDTLTRMDIVADGDPIAMKIEEHDRLYPSPDLEKVADALAQGCFNDGDELERLVNGDLHFRTDMVTKYKLPLSKELFYFGRPVFQLLQPLGVRVVENAEGVNLKWPLI